MDFRSAMQALGRPLNWREALSAIRAEHGKGTSRFLAGELGVSMRTAQRWQAGAQVPSTRDNRQGALSGVAKRDYVAAQALRRASTVTVGHVKVDSRSSGQPDGSRPVGTLLVDPLMRAELANVANLLENGQHEAAGDALSDALLGGYSAQRARDARHIAPGVLTIRDYPTGVDVG